MGRCGGTSDWPSCCPTGAGEFGCAARPSAIPHAALQPRATPHRHLAGWAASRGPRPRALSRACHSMAVVIVGGHTLLARMFMPLPLAQHHDLRLTHDCVAARAPAFAHRYGGACVLRSRACPACVCACACGCCGRRSGGGGCACACRGCCWRCLWPPPQSWLHVPWRPTMPCGAAGVAADGSDVAPRLGAWYGVRGAVVCTTPVVRARAYRPGQARRRCTTGAGCAPRQVQGWRALRTRGAPR